MKYFAGYMGGEGVVCCTDVVWGVAVYVHDCRGRGAPVNF